MNIAPVDLDAEYERAIAAWPFLHGLEPVYGLPYQLLAAVGSRETNLTNEVGDGGHGHGVWQLDDRSHPIPAGFDADVHAQAVQAAAMLRALAGQFSGRWDAVLAAYNAGAGTATYNLANGLNIDTGTAGGDYSADTLARMHYLQQRFPQQAPQPPEGDEMAKILYASGRGVKLLVAGDRVRVFTTADKEQAFQAAGYPQEPIDPTHFDVLRSIATPI